jgi:hypothetical protein
MKQKYFYSKDPNPLIIDLEDIVQITINSFEEAKFILIKRKGVADWQTLDLPTTQFDPFIQAWRKLRDTV